MHFLIAPLSNMHLGGPKKIHTPISPEYANVALLRLITVCVGLICLLITSYATWTIYVLTNHISNYTTILHSQDSSPRTIAPINFELFETTSAIDKTKQSFKLTPIVWDMFYTRTVTSTIELPAREQSTSTQVSSTPKL